MEGVITWEMVTYIVGLAATVGGGIFAIYKRIGAVEATMANYKLFVAENYIRNEHLERLEKRHSEELVRLTNAIESLSKRIDTVIGELKR